MVSRYLVTGGSGFLGSACVRRLVTEGHTVRVLDNHLRGRPRRLRDVADDIEMIEGDVRDAAAVRTAVAGMHEVVHLAFLNGTEFFYQYPELVLDIGVRGMLNVLDACRSEQRQKQDDPGQLFVFHPSELHRGQIFHVGRLALAIQRYDRPSPFHSS